VSSGPTKVIDKHLAFYWNGALAVLKRTVEQKEFVGDDES
jgi:hypothetical protein